MSRTNKRRRHRRSGFTLIELLVTIAIIAVLASIVAPGLFGNIGESRIATAKSQSQIIGLALDAYRVDNDAYPTSVSSTRPWPPWRPMSTSWRAVPSRRQPISFTWPPSGRNG